MPEKLAGQGITAKVEKIHQHGSFIVMRLTILHCDTEHILAEKLHIQENRLHKVFACLGCLSAACCEKRNSARPRAATLDEKAESWMRKRIALGLCKKLPEALPEQMAEKGI